MHETTDRQTRTGTAPTANGRRAGRPARRSPIYAITVILTVIAALTFAFSFGNTWTVGLRLGVDPWIAPLVGPAVDLSVVGLLTGIQYAVSHGVGLDPLRPARALLAFCGLATLALNVAETPRPPRLRQGRLRSRRTGPARRVERSRARASTRDPHGQYQPPVRFSAWSGRVRLFGATHRSSIKSDPSTHQASRSDGPVGPRPAPGRPADRPESSCPQWPADLSRQPPTRPSNRHQPRPRTRQDHPHQQHRTNSMTVWRQRLPISLRTDTGSADHRARGSGHPHTLGVSSRPPSTSSGAPALPEPGGDATALHGQAGPCRLPELKQPPLQRLPAVPAHPPTQKPSRGSDAFTRRGTYASTSKMTAYPCSASGTIDRPQQPTRPPPTAV